MKKKHPIEALIEQGEHQQLDFKFEVSDSKKIARPCLLLQIPMAVGC